MTKQAARRSLRIEGRGERVALRSLRNEELAKVTAWYDGTVAAFAKGDHLAITMHRQSGPIGVIDWRVDYPRPGWLTVAHIAVAPPYRARGYGSEAVRLLEAQAQRRGLARRFLAPVGLDNGLCLYFWLRLGYRPAHLGEVDWPGQPLQDIIAMVRFGDE